MKQSTYSRTRIRIEKETTDFKFNTSVFQPNQTFIEKSVFQALNFLCPCFQNSIMLTNCIVENNKVFEDMDIKGHNKILMKMNHSKYST